MAHVPKPAGTLLRHLAAVLLVLAFSVPGFGLGLHGDHRLDSKRQIELLEFEWRAAQLAGDLSAIDRLLSDDYVGINMTGQVNTKAQLLSRMRSHTFVLSRLDLREMKIRVLGEVAIVTVRAAVQGTNAGTPVTGNFRYTRIYHRLPSGVWKITNFEATKLPSQHPASISIVQKTSAAS